MNEQEAIARIKEHRNIHFHNELNAIYITEALDMAAQALEKQIPKKPVGDLNSVPHYRCAACGNGLKTYENSTVYPYCHYCGQKLLWGSDTE